MPHQERPVFQDIPGYYRIFRDKFEGGCQVRNSECGVRIGTSPHAGLNSVPGGGRRREIAEILRNFPQIFTVFHKLPLWKARVSAISANFRGRKPNGQPQRTQRAQRRNVSTVSPCGTATASGSGDKLKLGLQTRSAPPSLGLWRDESGRQGWGAQCKRQNSKFGVRNWEPGVHFGSPGFAWCRVEFFLRVAEWEMGSSGASPSRKFAAVCRAFAGPLHTAERRKPNRHLTPSLSPIEAERVSEGHGTGLGRGVPPGTA